MMSGQLVVPSLSNRTTCLYRLLIAIILGIAAMTSSCSASVPLPTEADALRASQHWPGTTLAELERGRTLYLSKCTNCHGAVAPETIQPEVWPSRVAAMRVRAKLRDNDATLLMRFLVSMAERHSTSPRQ